MAPPQLPTLLLTAVAGLGSAGAVGLTVVDPVPPPAPAQVATTAVEPPPAPVAVVVVQLSVAASAGPGGPVSLGGSAVDIDGWVRELRIDWGDGTAPTVIARNEPCVERAGGWPSGGLILVGEYPPPSRRGPRRPPPTPTPAPVPTR